MEILPDLDERSVLDIVEENFSNVNLKTYLVRMIYCGEHLLSKDDVIAEFTGSVDTANSMYCEIHLTGLLLVYDRYFVHIIEGSEDTIHRQIRFLFQRESKHVEAMEEADKEEIAQGSMTPENVPDRRFFKRMKMLMVYHSRKKALFKCWRHVYGRPPALVSKLDVKSPLAMHMEQLKVCLDKLDLLCSLANSDEQLNLENMKNDDPRRDAMPEGALLDFLLTSPHLLDLREVLHMHRRVDDHVFYFESVWPLPTHFTPRFLYKLKIDDSFVEPLPVMPWEIVKKEVKEGEEDEKEDKSDSESSD